MDYSLGQLGLFYLPWRQAVKEKPFFFPSPPFLLLPPLFLLFLFLLQGWTRKATALEFMGRHPDALEAYEEGLKVDPENKQLKDGKANAMKVR